MNAKLFVCLLLASILGSLTIFSQPINDYIGDYAPASPNAAAINKFTDIPVSEFTGVPNISIPIYTISEGPISVPINLSYHASGIKVAETASWVGLGWNLSCGGSVNRSVVGRRDDDFSGYMHNFCDSVLGSGTAAYSELLTLTTGDFDCEPDIFYFNFSGYSGKMVYFPTTDTTIDDWKIYPRSDLRVRELYGGDSVRISGFEFITPQGIKYIFGQGYIEKTEVSRLPTGNTGNNIVTTSWYLKRIATYDDAFAINFTYAEEKYKFTDLGSDFDTQGYNVNSSANCPAGLPTFPSDIYTFIEGYRLTGISTTSGKVQLDFIEGDIREDLDEMPGTNFKPKRLEEIQIKAGGSGFCKGFYFHYYYANGLATLSHEKRLVLSSLTESECGDQSVVGIKPPYTFTYNNIHGLPHRKSKQKDHWGYFNGVTSNESKPALIPYTAYVIFGSDTLWYDQNGADRESRPDFMKTGVLTKITYPEGGTVEFDYDANYEWGVKRDRLFETLVDNRWTNCDSTPGFNHIDPPVSMNAVELTSARFKIVLDLDNNTPYESSCDCDNNGDFNYTIKAVYDGLPAIPPSYYSGTLAAAGYCNNFDLGYTHISAFEPDLQPDMEYEFQIILDPIDGEGSLYFDIEYLPTINNPVGGLRVEKITADPILGAPVVTTYDYNDQNGQSTGQLLVEPRYGYTYYYQGNANVFFVRQFTSFPIVPTTDINGHSVGYAQVTRQRGDNKITRTFERYKQVSTGFPAVPLPHNYRNGAAISLSDQDLNNIIRSQHHEQEVHPENPSGHYHRGYMLFDYDCTYDGEEQTMIFYTSYNTPNSAYLRKKQEIEILDGVADTTKFIYSNQNLYTQPVKIKKWNSDGKLFETVYKYAPDLFGPSHFLNQSNMIGIPLETTINNGLAGGSKIEYSNSLVPGLILPTRYYGTKADGTWRLDKEILSANADGYPTSIQARTMDLPIELIWSTDPTEKGQLDTVKHGVLHTTYHYKNRLQLDSIRPPDGVTTSYTYDQIGRLQTQSEYDGNRITSYTYGLGSPLGGGTFIRTKVDFTPVNGSLFHTDIVTGYFDGLGRSIQTVLKGHSPNGLDIITETVFDSLGRVWKTYEPSEGPNASGNFFGGLDPGRPHTRILYQNSSLNRVKSEIPPEWHATIYNYETNGFEEVYNYDKSEYYSSGTLRKTRIVDANGVESIVFSDKKGRQVASYISGGVNNHAKTHKFFDDRDRLTTILPPDKEPPDTDEIYSYRYNENDLVVEKNIPGKLPIFLWLQYS